jgi:hypothetical protein
MKYIHPKIQPMKDDKDNKINILISRFEIIRTAINLASHSRHNHSHRL